jgi:hypothetical protein
VRQLLEGNRWLGLVGNGLALSLLFGLPAGLWYGGYDVICHYTLRALVWLTGRAPLDLATFLDRAAERVLVRKVGGGYIFIHRLLLEHFAGRHEGAGPGRIR